jgi:hypothetical protein
LKKLSITTLLLLFVATIAIGQTKTYVTKNRTYYHRNPFEKTFTKVQKIPTFGTDSSALKNYLTGKLKNQISQTQGEIMVGLLIDSTGKPLCEWIENRSNFKVENERLNLIVDEMPNWNAGVLANRKVNCALTLTLGFSQQNLLVQSRYRVGNE